MVNSRVLAFAVVGISILYLGCGPNDFNYGKIKNVLEGAPVHLDAEYVVLTQGQVDCGVHEDLWDPPVFSGHTAIARLTQKARDLKFSDDVTIGEQRFPFAQIRGEVNLLVSSINSDRDGREAYTKLVEMKVGANIQNPCFEGPLPVMGVRKGNFSQEVSPVLLFRFNNGWQFDSFQH